MTLVKRLLSDLGLGLRNIWKLADVERSQIVIATLMGIAHGILPTAIIRYADRFPDIAINLRKRLQSNVLEEVRQGTEYLGLNGSANIGGPLKAERFGKYSCRVAFPKDHDLLRRKTFSLNDLDGERLISIAKEPVARSGLDVAGVAAGNTLNSNFTVGQFTTTFRLISEGLGVAITPETFLAKPYWVDVASRPLRASGSVQHRGLINRRDRTIPPAAAAFLSIIRDCWPSAWHQR